MAYQVGDRVVYGIHGVCLIVNVEEQAAKGKKLYKNDEKVMKEAEKMLYEEFAHVLDIRPDQVLPFIMQQVEV